MRVFNNILTFLTLFSGIFAKKKSNQPLCILRPELCSKSCYGMDTTSSGGILRYWQRDENYCIWNINVPDDKSQT